MHIDHRRRTKRGNNAALVVTDKYHHGYAAIETKWKASTTAPIESRGSITSSLVDIIVEKTWEEKYLVGNRGGTSKRVW
jgi:hypothetical protein